MRCVVDYIFDSHLADLSSLDERDRQVFAEAYDRIDAIRAGNGWFQAFDQDVSDFSKYGKLTVPMLGLASAANYPAVRNEWPLLAKEVAITKIDDTGHFLPIEQPEEVAGTLAAFYG